MGAASAAHALPHHHRQPGLRLRRPEAGDGLRRARRARATTWPASAPPRRSSAWPRATCWPTRRCKQFLDRGAGALRGRRRHAPHHRRPRRRGLRAGGASHGRRLPRLAAVRRRPTTAALAALAPGLTPEMVAAVSKLMRNQDLIAVARKCRVVTRFRNTIGPARPPVGAAAAEPSDRRPARHRRLHARRPAARRRRCGDRHQPGLRQHAGARRAAAPARRGASSASRSRRRAACSRTSPTRCS